MVNNVPFLNPGKVVCPPSSPSGIIKPACSSPVVFHAARTARNAITSAEIVPAREFAGVSRTGEQVISDETALVMPDKTMTTTTTKTEQTNDNTLPERVDAIPSVSVDMADIAVLSDGESTSTDSSLDTVVEISQDETDRNTTNPATESNIEKSDRTKEKLQQDAVTAEVLADLFAAAAEELTTAEKLQLQQEQQELQPSPELFPPDRARHQHTGKTIRS